MKGLGWLLLGALVGAALLSVVVDYLNRAIAIKKLRENNLIKGVIREIVYSGGVHHVKLDTLDENGDEKQIEIKAADYDSSEIYEGETLYA